MKKVIFSFIALAFLSGGVVFAYDAGTEVHKIENGPGGAEYSVRVYSLYRYAEIAANARSLSAGEVVVMDSVSDDGVTIGLEGTAGSADSVVGVVISTTIPTADSTGTAAQTTGNRNWGYVQIYGLCEAAMVQSTVAAGQAICASDTTSYAAPRDAQGGNTGAMFGYALDAVSSNSEDVEIFIKNR